MDADIADGKGLQSRLLSPVFCHLNRGTAKIKIKSLFSADYADIADGKDQDQKRNAKTAKKALRNAKVFIFS